MGRCQGRTDKPGRRGDAIHPGNVLRGWQNQLRRAMLHTASSADPFSLLPGPARWLLCHPAAPSLRSIRLLYSTAPSCLAWPRHQSRLLWQVAGLADGNDHILGLAVPAPWCLGHLTHLIDTVADAVDITLVAVVIWTGAEDPVWRRERHKTSPWLHMATFRGKAGRKITAPHYILLLTLGVQTPGQSMAHPCPFRSCHSPGTGVCALPRSGLVFRLLVSGSPPSLGKRNHPANLQNENEVSPKRSGHLGSSAMISYSGFLLSETERMIK